MHARVEIFEDHRREHRWRLRAANGEIVAPPEGHRDITDAVRAFAAMRVAANEAADHPVFVIVGEDVVGSGDELDATGP